MSTASKKLLLIRLDRMGDLVLTLPVDSHPDLKDSECHWVVPKGLDFVVQNRSFSTLPKQPSYREFRKFVRWLRQQQFSAAAVFHGPWWLGLALVLAHIPTRVGPLSQWHSFLFFNKGVRQKRSECKYHELEYNYKLIEQGLDLQPLPQYLPLELKAKNSEQKFPTPYVIVHPGMGGSARNWPTENYVEAIQVLAQTVHVVITGTAMDSRWLNPIRRQLGVVNNVTWLDEQLSGEDLLALLNEAQAVLAPSTGVLHLAAALGTKTIGLYSPIKVQRPERWGPKGPRAKTLAPTAPCPATFSCLEKSCPHYDCMTEIKVDEIASLIVHP